MRQRGAAKVSLGDGDDDVLQRRRSALNNFVEYAPFMIFLVVLAELQGAHHTVVGLAAAVFFVGRLAHGYALSFTLHSPKLRPAGIILTLFAMVAMIGNNLAMFLF